MKMWNAPVLQELDVKLTASSGISGATESAGWIDGANGFVAATFDSAIYEEGPSGDCTIKIETSAKVNS